MPDMNENAETQQEYFGLVRTDNTATLKNALNKIAELEAQIEKMKCCKNCIYQGECDLSGYEECKNFDKWEIKEK